MLEPRDFWNEKILRWERLRYSPWTLLYPLSWTLRARLNGATTAIYNRVSTEARILELGCGSGLLADRLKGKYKNYLGIDIAPAAIRKALSKEYPPGFSFQAADVTTIKLPAADCAIFLGLTDWLEESKLRELFNRLEVDHILFSYTDAAKLSPYRAYRAYKDERSSNKARNYREDQIAAMLSESGFLLEPLRRAGKLDPGALIWASKSVSL